MHMHMHAHTYIRRHTLIIIL